MQKEQLLSEIQTQAHAGLITREDVVRAFELGSGVSEIEQASSRHINLANVLYAIGAAIIFIGIAILLGQNWSELSTFTRIMSTLGSGIVAYLIGMVLSRGNRFGTVGQGFFLLSVLVIPVGLGVVLDNAGMNVSDAGVQMVIAAISLALFGISFVIYRKTLFALFSILFGTWLYFSTANFMLGNNPIYQDWNLYLYLAMIAGISYLSLGYYISTRASYEKLKGFLYSFGSIYLLTAALALGGVWDVLAVGLVFLVIIMSVYLKSRALLTFGSLYLMAYLLKITSKYFSQSLGWPLALVIAGLLLMAVGYFSFYLNKKYIKNKTAF
jgi:hypothetical protein